MMKEKLYQICEDILENEEEAKQFLSCETLDELYGYFLSKLPELTKDEFEDFICEVLDSYAKEQENIEKVKGESLEQVSGGAFSVRTKIASGVLALMSMFPAAGAANVKKGNVDVGTVDSITLKEQVEKESPGVFQKIKAWVKAHPKLTIGLSIAAVALLATGGVYAYKRWQKSKTTPNSQKAGGVGNITNSDVGNVKGPSKVDPESNLSADEKKLIGYIKKGDLRALKTFISKSDRINLNFRDAMGRTPLIYAAEYRCESSKGILELLLNKGAVLGITDNDGNNALTVAAREGNVDAVGVFLKEKNGKRLIDMENSFGDTPLIVAAGSGQLEVVKQLREKGVHEDTTGAFGDTALIRAAKKGHADVVGELVNRWDADMKIQNEDGDTALICAVKAKDHRSVEMLLYVAGEYHETPLVDLTNKEGKTALFCAVEDGESDIVRQLLLAGGGAQAKIKKTGDTPLICAARDGNMGIVNMLLGYNADINEENNAHETALVCALKNGHTEIAKVLLGRRNIVTKGALVCAARLGDTEIVKLLLDRAEYKKYKDAEKKTEKNNAYSASSGKVRQILRSNILKDEINVLGDSWGWHFPGFNWDREKLYKLSVDALDNTAEDRWKGLDSDLEAVGFKKAAFGERAYQNQLNDLEKLLNKFQSTYQ